MKRRITVAISIVAFLIILILSVHKISDISLPIFDNNQGAQTGFFDEEKNSIDVIFLGTSNMFHSINPVIMYNDTGITSFDFGSSSQSLNMSYMYLKEALKTQKPKVVCLEVVQVYGNSSKHLYEPGMRWGFTYFPLGENKLEGLYSQLGGVVDFEYLSYVVPILRYKSRWKELTKEDFVGETDKFLKGCNASFITQPQSYPDDYFDDEEVVIKEANVEALDNIRKLCEKEGIELVLFKGPNTALWKDAYSKKVSKYAENYNLKYIDYNHLVDEISLDVNTDFQDESHVNIWGQTKVTKHMEEFLKTNFDLADHRGGEVENSYDKALKSFNQMCVAYYLSEAENIYSFMEMLEGNPYVVTCQINGNVDENVASYVREKLGMSEDSVAMVTDFMSRDRYFETAEMPYEWHGTIMGREFAIENRKIFYDYYLGVTDYEMIEYSGAFDGENVTETDYGVVISVYDKILEKQVAFAEFKADCDYVTDIK